MCAHAPVCNMDAKALERIHKNKHAQFELPIIYKILENYLTSVDIYELDPAHFF